MFNSVRETRVHGNGRLRMELEMKEDEFFTIYHDLNNEVAADIIEQYLIYRGDDGRAKDIRISHDPNTHIVNISATLHYLGNDKTDYTPNPDYLGHHMSF